MALDLLDLHGFKTDDVPDRLDRFLVQAQRDGIKRARVMTGKGTGAVQKVVTAYLKQGGFPFQFEKLSNGKANEGVIVVILD